MYYNLQCFHKSDDRY